MYISLDLLLSEKYVLKALLNPYDTARNESHESSSSSGSDSMSDEDIKTLFKSEYDLPCRPHRNVVRVLHHFCDRVEKEGTGKCHEYIQYISRCSRVCLRV